MKLEEEGDATEGQNSFLNSSSFGSRHKQELGPSMRFLGFLFFFLLLPNTFFDAIEVGNKLKMIPIVRWL